MGMLDDAIREHLELKKRHGAPEDEVSRLESEAFGAAARASAREPEPEPPADPAPVAPDEPVVHREEPVAWLDDDPDEVPAADALDHGATHEFTAADHAAATDPGDADDVLEETPDFLQETPEHERLWFEQKPPRDFDFDE